MPKKDMTTEQKKAWAEKMKAARAAKKAPAEPAAAPSAEIQAENQLGDLLAQIKEIQETNALLKAALLNKSGTQNTEHGLIGTFEKYITDPDYYPDPSERIAKEPRLARFAFSENYRIKYEVTTTTYETIDKRRVIEPQFKIDLLGVQRDEDGEPTGNLYIARRLVMHEDPTAAIAVARENNLPIDDKNEKAFLDEMRYIRIRDWVMQYFYRPKSQDAVKKREEVIGNQVVEVISANSEAPVEVARQL